MSGDSGQTYRWWDGATWTSTATWEAGEWVLSTPLAASSGGRARSAQQKSSRRARAARIALVLLAAVVIGVPLLIGIDEGLRETTMSTDDFVQRSCDRDLAELRSAFTEFREQNEFDPTERDLVESDWLPEESPYFDIRPGSKSAEIVPEDGSPCEVN